MDLDALQSRIDEFGPVAFLVTVGDDHRPHVVSVAVTCVGDHLALPAGRSTAANLAARPDLTLVWPDPNGGDYSLIVDAAAVGAPEPDGTFRARPSSAVLHRVAGASGTGPTCLPA